MRSVEKLALLALGTLIVVCILTVRPTMTQVSTGLLAEWQFDRPNDLQGWQPNPQIKDVKVSNGILSFRTVDGDPILELRAPLEISTSPWNAIEIRLKADRDGTAEFFWSNTTEPPYGGFRPNKRTTFWVIGDGKWRTYRVFPFWHPEGKIIRLRFDPFGDAHFEIDFIRIVELPIRQREVTEGEVGDLVAVGEVKLNRQKRGLKIVTQTPDSLLLAPANLDSERNPVVSVRLSALAGNFASFFFATEQTHGLHSHPFPIIADGKERTYTLDMIASPNWQGRIIAIGLRPTDDVRSEATLHSIEVGEEPKGEPSLQVIAFALDDAAPRAGVPTELLAVVRHVGGKPALNVRAILKVPAGIEVLSTAPDVKRMEFGEEGEFRWKVKSLKPMKGVASLSVSAANTDPVTAKCELNFKPTLTKTKAPYVPEPKPVCGKYEIGVYYFPGWKNWGQWLPILTFLKRKPVLGWYREGDPEVADWHIKWAVEHGITFFAYDWYWVQGARQLEHALHDGYLKSRYRHLLKFCLLWANHNPPKTSSLEDCVNLTRFWIEHYFRLPEYFTVDGKPLVIIFSPHRLREDLGSEGVRRALEAMRTECRNHGLKGLYIAACVADAGQAQSAAKEGYDAVTAYNWPSLGMGPGERWAPFDTLVRAYRRNWEHIASQSPIPLIVPVSGGWDSRPWHGESALVRFGRNPQNFKQHLQDAKTFLDKFVPQGKALPIAIIEAWNEWGEGSYIEPHAEFGFGYLDAIREVFTHAPRNHIDIAPIDVGLGPYEVERTPLDKNDWEFESGAEGWEGLMQLVNVRVEKGCLVGQTTGNDPAFVGPPMQIRASDYPFLVIRMRLTKIDVPPPTTRPATKDIGQVFWRTKTLPESEATSFRFEVTIDGEWHEYRLPVHENKRWRGTITRLRLDPCTKADIIVEVDGIKALH